MVHGEGLEGGLEGVGLEGGPVSVVLCFVELGSPEGEFALLESSVGLELVFLGLLEVLG